MRADIQTMFVHSWISIQGGGETYIWDWENLRMITMSRSSVNGILRTISFEIYVYGNNFMFLKQLSTKSTMWSCEPFLEVVGDPGQNVPQGGGP